jgi:hypothetical protein
LFKIPAICEMIEKSPLSVAARGQYFEKDGTSVGHRRRASDTAGGGLIRVDGKKKPGNLISTPDSQGD